MYQDNLKLTKIGWLPKEWEVKRLEQLVIIDKESLSNNTPPDYEFEYISLSDTDAGNISLSAKKIKFKDAPSRARRVVKQNDVLISTVRPNLQNFVFIKNEVNNLVASTGFSVLTAKKDFENEFGFYCLFSTSMTKQLYNLVVGSNYPAINSSDVKSLQIPLPPLAEQQKIASILRGCDAVIDKTQALINALQKRHKALMQQLLTGKKRVLGFEKEKGFHFTDLGLKIPKNWKIINVEDIFNERNEKSNDQTAFPLYSLTIEKGLTAKTDRYDRSFLLKDKEANEFKVVSPMDLLFNPMNLRFGAIAMSYENQKVSVSAYYNILIPKVKLIDSFFYESIFKSKRFIGLYDRIAIGSLNEKKRVHLSNFLKLEIPFPSLAEQQEIAEILRGSEKEIQLYEKQLAALKQQKRGLMQVLLTGRVRVKVN